MVNVKGGNDYDEWGWVDESPAKNTVPLKSIGNTPPISPAKKAKSAPQADSNSANRKNAQDLLTNYANNIRKLILTARSQIGSLNKEIEELKLQLKSSGVVKCPSCSETFKERNHRQIPKYIKIFRGKFTIELEFANNDLLGEWLTLNGLDKMADGLPTLLPVKNEEEPTLDSTGSQIKTLFTQKAEETKKKNEEARKASLESRKENFKTSKVDKEKQERVKDSMESRKPAITTEKRKHSPEKQRERRYSPEKKRTRKEPTDRSASRVEQPQKAKEREQRSNSPRNRLSLRSRGKADQISANESREKDSSKSRDSSKYPARDIKSPKVASNGNRDHSSPKETKALSICNKDGTTSRVSNRDAKDSTSSRKEKENSKSSRRDSRHSETQSKGEKRLDAACKEADTSEASYKLNQKHSSSHPRDKDLSRASQRKSERIRSKTDERPSSSLRTSSTRSHVKPKAESEKEKTTDVSPQKLLVSSSVDQPEDGEIVDSCNESSDEAEPQKAAASSVISKLDQNTVPDSPEDCEQISCIPTTSLETGDDKEEPQQETNSKPTISLREPNELAFCSLDENEPSYDSNKCIEQTSSINTAKPRSPYSTVLIEQSLNQPLLQTMKFPDFKYSHIAESPGLRISNFDSPDYSNGQTPSDKGKSDTASCTPSDFNSVHEQQDSSFIVENEVLFNSSAENTLVPENDVFEKRCSSTTNVVNAFCGERSSSSSNIENNFQLQRCSSSPDVENDNNLEGRSSSSHNENDTHSQRCSMSPDTQSDTRQERSLSSSNIEVVVQQENEQEELENDSASQNQEHAGDQSILDNEEDGITEDGKLCDDKARSTDDIVNPSDEDDDQSDCDDDMFGVVVSCEEDILSDNADFSCNEEEEEDDDCMLSDNDICTDHENEYD